MSAERNPSFPDKKVSSVSYDRITDHIMRTQALQKEMAVGQEEATWLPYGEYPQLPISVTWMSDVHYGNTDVDYQTMSEHINAIASTPNMFVIFGGDMIDNFNPAKYPDGMMSDAVGPEDQARAWFEMLQALDARSKIGALVWGNHEEFSKVAGINMFSTFFRNVSCPIFTDGGGVLNVVTEGEKYRLGIRHTFWGNSKLNKTNAPKRMMQFGYDNLDAAFVGHVHTASGEMFQNAGREQIAVTGGTYKINDKFGKKWGHRPEMGGLTITLDPTQHKMTLHRDPLEAQSVILNRIQAEIESGGYTDPYTQLREQLQDRG